MDDESNWFAPKRYGYGAGPPIRWQGWAVLAAYAVLIGALCLGLQDQPLKLVAAIIPPTLALILIASRTTRGGWRWRWGQDR